MTWHGKELIVSHLNTKNKYHFWQNLAKFFKPRDRQFCIFLSVKPYYKGSAVMCPSFKPSSTFLEQDLGLNLLSVQAASKLNKTQICSTMVCVWELFSFQIFRQVLQWSGKCNFLKAVFLMLASLPAWKNRPIQISNSISFVKVLHYWSATDHR